MLCTESNADEEHYVHFRLKEHLEGMTFSQTNIGFRPKDDWATFPVKLYGCVTMAQLHLEVT
jgi:hypothetical protein